MRSPNSSPASAGPSAAATTGLEVRVYDHTRVPRDWHRLLRPWQCAVLFRRVNSEASVSADGVPFGHIRASTFWLFDRLAEARAFCEKRVCEHPEVCAEIYDDRGKSRPPLVVVMAAQAAGQDELSAASARHRRLLAILLILCSLPLFWWDWRTGGRLVLPTFLGPSMILAARRATDRLEIACGCRARDIDEHPRIDGADCSECRPEAWDTLARVARDVRADGGFDHPRDRAHFGKRHAPRAPGF